MSKQYTTLGWYGDESVTADEIIVEDKEPRWTGLLDSYGRKLYPVDHSTPVGFVRLKES